MSFKMRFVLLVILLSNFLSADIKSSSETLKFDVNNDSTAEMTLTETGLGIGLSTPSSNLDLRGSLAYGISTVTSDANLENLNSIILVGSSVNNIVLTLPDPSSVVGRTYTIKHSQNSGTSTLSSSANIDGMPYLALKTIPGSTSQPYVTVISDGATWNVINYKNQEVEDTVASSNLLFWWSFDDSPTTSFADLSSLNNDGVLNGSADFEQVDGRMGAAVRGLSQQVFLSISDASTGTLTDLSVGFWIKASDAAEAGWSDWRAIIDKSNFTNGWQIDVDNSSPRRLRSRIDASSSSSNRTSSAGDVFDDTWHHIVYTAGAGSINYYVDGSSVASNSYSTGSGNTIENSENLTVQLEPDMYLDEVRLYNRVLTSDEVSEWFSE